MARSNRDVRNTLLLAAAIVTSAIVAKAVPTTALADPSQQPDVVRWAARVAADEAQPVWKRDLARTALALAAQGRVAKQIAFNATWYAEQNDLDPTGGGFWTASGLHVAYGLVATDNKHWPIGTVFYCDELGRALVVADNGPAVRGPRALDVWVPDAATRDALCRAWKGNDGRGVLHLRRLGRVNIRQVGKLKGR